MKIYIIPITNYCKCCGHFNTPSESTWSSLREDGGLDRICLANAYYIKTWFRDNFGLYNNEYLIEVDKLESFIDALRKVLIENSNLEFDEDGYIQDETLLEKLNKLLPGNSAYGSGPHKWGVMLFNELTYLYNDLTQLMNKYRNAGWNKPFQQILIK